MGSVTPSLEILGGGTGTFGIKKSHSALIHETTLYTNLVTGTGIVDYSNSYPFVDPHSSINDFSTYLTYEHPLSDRWMGYASLTLDKHDDLAPRWDPRIATIYTINPDNVLKFSISRAHRNPSWEEMFTINNPARLGNPNLKAESVVAYETQYIHTLGLNHTLSVNFFRLQNQNQIYLQPDTGSKLKFINGQQSTITGFETEWHKRYDTLSFYAAYTHLVAKDGDGTTLPDAPSNTLSGFMTYHWNQNVYTSFSGRWQGKTPRTQTDPRPSMQAMSTIDSAVGYTLPTLHSEIQLSVKNMLNQTQLYPSPMNIYNSDYPGLGRTYLITLRGTF